MLSALPASRSMVFGRSGVFIQQTRGWGRSRCFSSSTQVHGPFQLAIIGSGPAGFYAAHKVMQRLPDARVDMFEQLPVPFGLVRFGVAPDHPEVKNCEDKFTEVAASPRFGFFGNVEIGKSIHLSTLRENYDAILFAYGASKDRELGVPGEDGRGIYSARAFVGWYNGLPEFANLNPDLESSDTAAIIGQGNVALDVARVLLRDTNDLKATDISANAIETLRRSRIRRVRIIGRRGPMQAAFTIKEVRELLQLRDVRFESLDSSLLPSKDVELPRAPKRIAQLLSKHSTGGSNANATKYLSFDFLRSPIRFNQTPGSSGLASLTLEQNTWVDEKLRFDKNARVIGTNKTLEVEAGLAFRSIGYKAERLPGMTDLGIDFDDNAGRLLNDQGRVLQGGKVSDGLYCAGWVKSGPTGVIATTMDDAFSTAETIARDWHDRFSTKPGSFEIQRSLPRHVDWYGWQRIDLAERSRGKDVGKEREKFCTVQEMLKAA